MMVKMLIMVLWIVIVCSLVVVISIVEDCIVSIIMQFIGSTFLWDIGNHLQGHVESQPRDHD
jgi:hypothetical protein